LKKCVDAVAARPDTVGKAGAMSPSVWVEVDGWEHAQAPRPLTDGSLLRLAEPVLRSARPPLWVCWGLVREGGFHNARTEALATSRGRELADLCVGWGYTRQDLGPGVVPRSDADLFVWSSRQNKGERGLEVHGLSRGGGLTAADARLFSIALPSARKAQTEDAARVAAYLIAKHLQPALSDPQAFRAEKIRELAAELDSVLAQDLPVSQALRNEVEADFCSAGIRVAEEMGELGPLEKVIQMRRRHLEAASLSADTGRIIQAKLELGRALIVRAEKQFDQAVVKEAISHLAQAVEGLRSDPTIQRAQSASDALFKAQAMIESRKRFSLNFGS
jgi:hypothetical protein